MTLALLERLDERLTPLERLEALTDPGSMQLLRTRVRSRRMGDRARPGDGVLAAHACRRAWPPSRATGGSSLSTFASQVWSHRYRSSAGRPPGDPHMAPR